MDAKNLIVFMSDGHDPRYLGSAGHPLMHTPALDRLAERGTRFSNAYTACPICVPARASFATGRHVHQTGCCASGWTRRRSTPKPRPRRRP